LGKEVIRLSRQGEMEKRTKRFVMNRSEGGIEEDMSRYILSRKCEVEGKYIGEQVPRSLLTEGQGARSGGGGKGYFSYLDVGGGG